MYRLVREPPAEPVGKQALRIDASQLTFDASHGQSHAAARHRRAPQVRAANFIAHACRTAAERKEEQLRGWLQEVRIERRKLEDRLLQGSSCALQDTRAELEAVVTVLRGSLAAAEAEAAAVGASAAERTRLQVRQ